MNTLITGIHHVTAVTGDAQENIDFYAGILGLRLLKQTVNFDNPEVYHFYFGDQYGSPGTIMTTFPSGKDLREGRHGKGMLNTTAFSIDIKAMNYWLERLTNHNIAFKQPQQRFGDEAFIYLEDYDGLGIELIFTGNDARQGYANKVIPQEYSIKGIHHVEIWLDSWERTAALLTTHMNHQLIKDAGGRFRYAAEDMPGKYIDLLWTPDELKGLAGRGTVHHVAFITPNNATQLAIMEKLDVIGLQHTEVKDRKYFRSVYFREPGGVIFEVATPSPGFAIDEDIQQLGYNLKLPEQYEFKRAQLEQTLPAFNYDPEKFR